MLFPSTTKDTLPSVGWAEKLMSKPYLPGSSLFAIYCSNSIDHCESSDLYENFHNFSTTQKERFDCAYSVHNNSIKKNNAFISVQSALSSSDQIIP
jgi:hypothetical protein